MKEREQKEAQNIENMSSLDENVDILNYEKIEVPEMDEADVLGMLLEKYTEGTTYDKETKSWIVPNEVYDRIKNSREQGKNHADFRKTGNI